MVPLTRLRKPDVLAAHEEGWRTKLLSRRASKPGCRPQTSQYGHQEIVAALAAMSHWKCFYCEQGVKDGWEVDHFIEVEERPDLSFEWTNLYLSCKDCNAKLANKVIPVGECLDPCAPDCRPADHLTFDAEVIVPRDGSRRGRQTIKKYKLDRLRLDHQRGRQLRLFHEALLRIRERQIQEGRRALNEDERSLLRGFGDPSQPFSLMFTGALARSGLLGTQ